MGVQLMGFCLASGAGDSSPLGDHLSVSLHPNCAAGNRQGFLLEGWEGPASTALRSCTCVPSMKYLKKAGHAPSPPPHPVGQVPRAVKLEFEGLRVPALLAGKHTKAVSHTVTATFSTAIAKIPECP